VRLRGPTRAGLPSPLSRCLTLLRRLGRMQVNRMVVGVSSISALQIPEQLEQALAVRAKPNPSVRVASLKRLRCRVGVLAANDRMIRARRGTARSRTSKRFRTSSSWRWRSATGGRRRRPSGTCALLLRRAESRGECASCSRRYARAAPRFPRTSAGRFLQPNSRQVGGLSTLFSFTHHARTCHQRVVALASTSARPRGWAVAGYGLCSH